MQEEEARSAQPVRVVELELDDGVSRAALLGSGSEARRCRVVLVQMLPVAEPAQLRGVMPHGLLIGCSAEDAPYDQLLVPWTQISYITTS